MAKVLKSLPLNAFIAAVGAAAIGLMALWLSVWHGPYPDAGHNLLLVGLLLILAAAASHFPLPVGPKYNVNSVTAVAFAALLLFGPPAAMALIGAGVGAGLASIRFRTWLQGRTARSWRSIVFNVAQHMVSTAVGGAVYYAFLPHNIPGPQERVENVIAVPLAAAAIYLTSSGLVACIVGIQRRENPLDIWRSVRRRDVLHEAGLFLLGLVTARTAQNDPWIPLVMVLPAWIFYLSTKRNVQLVEQTISAVEALADVVDRRDRYTFQHSKRVADYSVRIARAMKLSAEDVEQIRLAARVHDLGKIGVPNDVLHKPGNLTQDEWQLMRAHPEMGHEILAKFPEYREGRELVLAHHERYDGKGYPNGLAGRRLRLGAQIIAVADTLDAMTSDRPYRKALPIDVALAELRKGKGSQFNPDVVETLERLVVSDLARGRSFVTGAAPAVSDAPATPSAPSAPAEAAPAPPAPAVPSIVGASAPQPSQPERVAVLA